MLKALLVETEFIKWLLKIDIVWEARKRKRDQDIKWIVQDYQTYYILRL